MNKFKFSRKIKKKKMEHTESEYLEYEVKWQTNDIESKVIPMFSILNFFVSHNQNRFTSMGMICFLFMCSLYFLLKKEF